MTPEDLRALRSRLGLTQAALADRLGLKPYTVTRWESEGKNRRPVPRHVVTILREWGASAAAPEVHRTAETNRVG